MNGVENSDANLIETRINSKEIYHGRLLHVFRDEVRLPDGRTAEREWIKHPGAAAVIPITDEGEVILVRQYRYPVGQVTLEVPAGKLDVIGEEPLSCACRELAEETGCSAREMKYLTEIKTTVGFTNERIYIYMARGLAMGPQNLDDDEFINVVRMPMADAVEKVMNGEITDAKSCVAILMASRL
ncbi:MAG: NUDIX hydrolase [Selenomonadaceae bacterium]|nr:NUDIX hydrolase [Selenomonadaceae bacterium]